MNNINPYDLLLLESSGELTVEQAASLAAWRAEHPGEAASAQQMLEMLTTPLSEHTAIKPLPPLVRDRIMKEGRDAMNPAGAKDEKPAGKLIEPVWEREGTSSNGLLYLTLALAATFLFGLFVVNRGGFSSPEIAQLDPDAAVPALPAAAPDAAAIAAILDEPFAELASGFNNLEASLLETEVEGFDQASWVEDTMLDATYSQLESLLDGEG